LRGADFLSLKPLDGGELEALIEDSMRLKQEGVKGHRPLANRVIGLLFEKPSTRTRVSFEVAVLRLGGYPMVLIGQGLQLDRGESIEDTGRVLSRYVDGLVVRTFGQDRLEALAGASGVPVVNALSDQCHPCQALADMLTVQEYKGSPKGLKLAYMGDGNNVTHSLMRAGTKLGMNVSVATPEGREPLDFIIEECREYCDIYGSSLEVGNDPASCAAEADVLYTDVWVSMGASEQDKRDLDEFMPFQVNQDMLSHAGEDVMVMHCLPAHRGEDQAENRLHAQVALLSMIFG
jgi:ornithine carbamoyltransferase